MGSSLNRGAGTSGSLGNGGSQDVYIPTFNPYFTSLGFTHIKGSSTSFNFFGRLVFDFIFIFICGLKLSFSFIAIVCIIDVFEGWNDPSVTNERIGCPALCKPRLPAHSPLFPSFLMLINNIDDECASRNNDCDNNAYCTDLERGYTCTCKSGYPHI